MLKINIYGIHNTLLLILFELIVNTLKQTTNKSDKTNKLTYSISDFKQIFTLFWSI